jgi:hypothetical protein
MHFALAGLPAHTPAISLLYTKMASYCIFFFFLKKIVEILFT